MEVDKYLKKLSTVELIELLANSQINQKNSLKDISNDFNNDESTEVFDNQSISASQISPKIKRSASRGSSLFIQKYHYATW